MAGLYIHVPFCRRKCAYCAFYSLPASEEVRQRYAARLCAMLSRLPRPFPAVESVYFGGGTPPLLGADAIAAILDAARRHPGVRDGAEITVECNPESTDAAFLEWIAAAGVNRLSFGLQSVHAEQLRRLGRAHTPQDAARVLHEARRAGIRNLSLDVMLALPGQTEASLERTLAWCLGQDVPHLSAYLLSIEEGTRFAAEGVRPLPEDEQAALYLYAADRLERAGLRSYEISNFARPGYESRHNRCYWTLGEYLGLGPAAHSFWGGRRLAFPADLRAFLEAPDPFALFEDLGTGGDLTETVMLRLRLREGLPVDEAAHPGLGAETLLSRAGPLIRAGLLRHTGGALSLTPRGALVSNSIVGALLGF